jgi:hypothetical protein
MALNEAKSIIWHPLHSVHVLEQLHRSIKALSVGSKGNLNGNNHIATTILQHHLLDAHKSSH